MAANHKSTKQTVVSSYPSTEYHLKLPSPDVLQTKARPASSNRSVASNIRKSPLSFSTVIARSITPSYSSNYRQYQQDSRCLYVVNTPDIARRTISARTSNIRIEPLPLHQQPHALTSPLLPRPHPQYGHFLAYLRRQSLARRRRKKEEENDHFDTTLTFNSSKPSSQSFHSVSNTSLGTLASETTPMPAITPSMKSKARPSSSYRQLQRSSSVLPTNCRLTSNPSTPIKKTTDNHLLLLPSKSLIVTPTNSLVDENNASSSANPTPYELKLSGDMLSYCYVSDSGVTYQGQLLATPV